MRRTLLAGTLLCAAPVFGAEMIGTHVRSDKLKILRAPHEVEEFTGNVVYKRQGRYLRADWARYDHLSRVLRAEGNIRAEQLLTDGGKLQLRGAKARHDRGARAGNLLPRRNGRVEFSRFSAAGSRLGHGGAETLSWKADGDHILLDGDVVFVDERGEARAESARYDHKSGILILQGRRPVLSTREETWSAAVQADRVRAEQGSQEDRRVLAEGAAHGWIHFRERPGPR